MMTDGALDAVDRTVPRAEVHEVDRARLRLPTQAREVYDVTGAGDTVIGTLAALMAGGLSLREAAPHANRAAGIVVSRFGTAAVTRSELAAQATA